MSRTWLEEVLASQALSQVGLMVELGLSFSLLPPSSWPPHSWLTMAPSASQ